jgi:subtilisin-like proprotein convertase family protein
MRRFPQSASSRSADERPHPSASRSRKTRYGIVAAVLLTCSLLLLVPTVFLSGGAPPQNRDSGGGGTQDTTKRIPQFARAVAFGESAPLRSLPAARFEPNKESRFADQEDRVINTKNEKIIKKVVEGAGGGTDGVLRNGPAQPSVMPGPSLTFEGNSGQENATAYGFRVMPPDTVGDVGPNHYVQITNLLARVFTKAGTPLTAPFKLSSLFASFGAPCGLADDGDPIVLYDSLADRWLISDFCTDLIGGRTSQRIAISTTPDPTGTYFVYLFIMPNTKFNDYPHFGVWPDAYYMTDNQFNQAGTAFLGAGVFAFERAKMLTGDPTSSFIYFDLETSDPDSGGQLPTDFDGLAPPATGTPGVIMEFFADEFGPFTDSLRIFEFRPNFAIPANSTFTRLTPDLPLAAFDARQPAGRTDIEQPPPATAANNVDSISDRMMHRIAYRNLGTVASPVNSYVANFTVNVSGVNPTTAALYQAGIRWVELRRSSMGAMSVFDQGTHVSGPVSGATGANTWMGSIAQDNQGNLALGYSISSTSIFPSIAWAGRTNNVMNSGTLNEGEATMFAGTGVQQGSGSFVRWGDYSAMGVDPADDCTFYYTQEYRLAANNGTASAMSFNWNTRVGAFKFPTCTTSPRGTFSGTITNCATGMPIQGAVIETTSPAGFFDQTDASGNYSILAAPGTYSVKVSKPGPGGFNTATGMVTVTNGGNAIFNACLQGVPIIMANGATLQAESCTPANMNLDPNETVTVNFCLKNTGGAATMNLVGTLQATGGVTSPSGPQNYGAVPADGTTSVCRPFTFTVANQACGSTVTATIQLQDGATNLGTITYTFTLGSTTTQMFSNPAAIVVPAVGTGNATTPSPAAPYPSIITVAGVTQPIAKVTVSLNSLTHTFPDDLDVLLVGPGGQKLLLMSDNGLGDDITGVTLTLDDAAAASLPDNGPLVTGTFKPTNFGTGDTFVAPAPAGPYPDPQMLSVFNGTTANGAWSLYIVDDAAVDTGTFNGGWTLNITTRLCSTTCPAGTCTSITCPANITKSNDPGQCGAVVTYPPPTPNGSGCGTISCSPSSGSFFPVGTTTVNCTASAGPTCAFTVTVNDTQPPTITCPPNQVRSNDPNQCGAVVNYPPPTASDNCPNVGTPMCSPASGSFFPVGTTTVTCTVSDASGNTAMCTFTVTVNDTQPPTITCPANVVAVTPVAGASGVVVCFPPPTASDNCPGVTTMCVPPSGSTFAIGCTTVTCTATDASGNTKTCPFTVCVFNARLQDDSNPAIVVLWNTMTGDYIFCCGGTTFTGRGKFNNAGNNFVLDHNGTDRRVRASLSAGSFPPAGNASLQFNAGSIQCTIRDSDTRNDTSICGGAAATPCPPVNRKK